MVPLAPVPLLEGSLRPVLLPVVESLVPDVPTLLSVVLSLAPLEAGTHSTEPEPPLVTLLLPLVLFASLVPAAVVLPAPVGPTSATVPEVPVASPLVPVAPTVPVAPPAPVALEVVVVPLLPLAP